MLHKMKRDLRHIARACNYILGDEITVEVLSTVLYARSTDSRDLAKCEVYAAGENLFTMRFETFSRGLDEPFVEYINSYSVEQVVLEICDWCGADPQEYLYRASKIF